MARTKKRPPRPRGRAVVRDRMPKARVVFCVEGKTEEQYLRKLVEERYQGHVVPVFWGSSHRSSLKNLIQTVQRQSKTDDVGEGVWIICDSDQNSVHVAQLEEWLREDAKCHRVAVTNPCIEYWLLLHYVDSPRCSNAKAAVTELRKHLTGYVKGRPLPADLLQRTNRAVERERKRSVSFGNRGVWPDGKCSQIPLLIDWLDVLVERRRTG